MEAERRQVTVLFADMVGFTTFSERSGEEAAFTLMRSLWRLMADAVREQGGAVHDFTGDGIMAVFGVPVALEDGALRGARAALSILQRVKAASPALETEHGVRPRMRIGLNTGVAVVGRVEDNGDAANAILGDTVNFAARLQALAEPDAVLMSEAVHRSVQGIAIVSFAGEHTVKGKSGPQKVYRLDGIRRDAPRFEVAVSRGLSPFAGRERELHVLECGFDKIQHKQISVIDIAAEPGMGKSRLVHEFHQHQHRACILSGSCSPDGKQTPFLPLLDVVRGWFRINTGEVEKDVEQKLKTGLTELNLLSVRNVGLLLHLLGLKVPDGALTGLDGVLIGLRTRELLQQLLETLCRLSPVIMLIEDTHWIDSASEELLSRMVDGTAKLRLLLLTTRRPEYSPPWLERSIVTKLRLQPLASGDILHLIQSRLGVVDLPEPLWRQISEKAGGNPLFAEEIVSFLTERGILQGTASKRDFDASAVANALPASVESLVTARVDRLAPRDRALLQAASVIGRGFNSQLLARVFGDTDVDARLAAMQALDLVRCESRSGNYVFKHTLIRDALYHSLLSAARRWLHLKVADEIERLGGNRLAEVAEVLAHHYSRADRPDKAFTYLSLAGSKSFSVYSLDEAETHFSAALALLDKNPDCASDEQVAEFLATYVLHLHMSAQFNGLIAVIERHLTRIHRLGEDPKVALIRQQYVIALWANARYQEAATMQRETSLIADHLEDSRSKAYALAGEILVSTTAPKSLCEFEVIKRNAIAAASDTTDAYLQNWIRSVIGWEEISRGRITHARDLANEVMQVGQLLGDPRSTGLSLWLLAAVAILSESYTEALACSEKALGAAVTPYDRLAALASKATALVMLRRIEEALSLFEEHRRLCLSGGFLSSLTVTDPFIGICKVLQGNIGAGIRHIEIGILRREAESYQAGADWYRGFLCEVYLQIIAGREKLTIFKLLKNLPLLLKVFLIAPSRITALTGEIMKNPQFDSSGSHVGRTQMALGLLYKIKKKRALALQHLNEARRIFSQFGQTPILGRVETALAELGQ